MDQKWPRCETEFLMLLSLNTSELIPVLRWRKKRGGQKEEEPLPNFKSQVAESSFL